MPKPTETSYFQKKLPLRQALLTILLATIAISGSAWLAFTYYKHIKDKQRSDPAYHIIAIVQTSLDREGLKTSYLAELLDLSIDKPRNLYSFNIQEGVKALLNVPVIKEASIRKIRPGTLHVDYTLRKPIAYLKDYSNAAIDASGTMFPFKPFYTPKNLPEIYLGDDQENHVPPIWGTTIKGERKNLAFELLACASQYCDRHSSLCCIDVSQAFAASDGQRQIVLILENRLLKKIGDHATICIYPHLLRLRQENYREQLGNYLVLRPLLRERSETADLTGSGNIKRAKATIVDLRLSELAFIAYEP